MKQIQPMINYKQADVVLVEFQFSEGSGSKKRPALIISTDAYHKSRQEVIVAAITSNITRELLGDTKIEKWEEAGLLQTSLVTGIIRTIKSNLILRELGVLPKKDFLEVQKNFKSILGL